MRVAVTGGTGFVGTALIDQLLKNGWEVAALVRDPAKAPAGARIVKGDLEDEAALGALAKGADIFIHLAGLTHARARADYHTVNVAGAERAFGAASKAGARIVHASSLSARMPDLSPYARSKRDSEAVLVEAAGASPWIALRLPAIYGPGDRATLPYFKMVKAGFAPEPKTAPPARASLLFVDDAVDAILAGAAKAPPGAVYEVGDDRLDGYGWAEIGATLAGALGRRARPLALPRPIASAHFTLNRAAAQLLGRPPSMREGQINEFFHPDWAARHNRLNDAIGWTPKTPLQEGFAKTALWYQEHGLL